MGPTIFSSNSHCFPYFVLPSIGCLLIFSLLHLSKWNKTFKIQNGFKVRPARLITSRLCSPKSFLEIFGKHIPLCQFLTSEGLLSDVACWILVRVFADLLGIALCRPVIIKRSKAGQHRSSCFVIYATLISSSINSR